MLSIQTQSKFTNAMVLTIPALTLLGWATQIQNLKLLFHMSGTAMNPLSAVCFLLLGASLAVARDGRSPRSKYLSFGLAFLPFVVALFHGFSVSGVRLDQLLFASQLNGNIMPNHTALGFFVASLAVMGFHVKGYGALTLSPLLALGVGWLALLAIVGYFYRVDLLNQTRAYTPMAFGSATTFLFFAISILLGKAEYEPTRTLVSPTDAGRIARRLIPLALCFPVISGYLRMAGEAWHVFDPKLGVTIFALINIAVWASAIWTTAHYLYRAEQKNKYLIDFLDKNAKTDLLSGLWNRRYLEERLEGEAAALRRHERTFSCIICDIDFFKKVNDTFGHPIGDVVIKTVAQTLLNTARKEDVVCRFGGEEFVLLLPDTKGSDAALLAERLRVAVESLKIESGAVKLNVTCSFGVAQAYGDGSAVLDRADENLYAAKQNGRNRVVWVAPGAAIKAA